MSIKRIASFALCALLLSAAFALAPAAEGNFRYDDMDSLELITPDEAEALVSRLDSLSASLELDVAVWAVDNISAYYDDSGNEYTNYAVFAADYYEKHVYPGDYVSAAVLMYERDGNYVYILTIGEAEECIDISAMFTTLKDEYEANGYYAMFCKFADECERIIPDYRANPGDYAQPEKGERGTIKEIPYGDKKVRYVDLGDTGVLTAEQQEALMKKLDSKSEELQFDIVVVTIDDISKYKDTEGSPYGSYQAFADDFFDYYGNGMYGYGDNYSGALIMYEVDGNYRYISTCGEGETAVDFETTKEAVIGYFNNRDFDGAFNAFADSCVKQVENARSFHLVRKLIIALAIALIISLIVVHSMKKKLTSVQFASQANDYVRPGSLNLTESRDTFLYSAVTRTVRETESRSGGGGGSHTSSSGRSHGGGGF